MKRRFSWNIRTTVGLVIGVLTPLLALPLVMLILAGIDGTTGFFNRLWYLFIHDSVTQCKFISLSIIPNLGWFYFFLNKERYDIARGIIIGSAAFIPYILYVNFS